VCGCCNRFNWFACEFSDWMFERGCLFSFRSNAEGREEKQRKEEVVSYMRKEKEEQLPEYKK
jgi:hypothetical protein